MVLTRRDFLLASAAVALPWRLQQRGGEMIGSMRDVRVDLVWTTDANGNATIQVPIPVTGAWHNLKFALRTPGNPHWTVFVGGTPLTHGSGERVTLGPELIRDGEKVTITVTGAVGNAAGIGSANGVAGPPDQILAGYAPAPNTLSVEIASLTGSEFLTELNTGATASITFPLPPLIQNIICVGRTVVAASTVSVTGRASGGTLTLPLTTNGQVLIFPASLFSLIDFNTSFGALVAVFGNTTALDVYLQLGSMVTPVNTLNSPLFVQFPGSTSPLLWQAAQKTTAVAIRGLAAAGNSTIIAGAIGQKIYLFAIQVQVDEAAGGAAFEVFRLQSTTTFQVVMAGDGAGTPRVWNHHGGGAPLPTSEGLQLVNNDNVQHNYSVSVAFSQG